VGEGGGGVEETWYCAFVYRRRAYLTWWPPQPAKEVYSYKPLARSLILEMLSIRSTGALKYRGIRDPGLLVRDVFLPLVVFGFFCEQDSVYKYPISLARPHTLREV
jgi:hypothetical protein